MDASGRPCCVFPLTWPISTDIAVHRTKGHHVRAAALHYSLLRSFARGFTRTICCCLVLLACLAQLWMSAQYRHTPGFVAHAMVSRAAAEGLQPYAWKHRCGATGRSLRASWRPCQLPSRATALSLRQQGRDCPCCPFCPCCTAVHAAMGILPQEMARADDAPFVSTFAAPPAVLGLITRFVAFARAAPSASRPDLIDEFIVRHRHVAVIGGCPLTLRSRIDHVRQNIPGLRDPNVRYAA